MRNKLNGGFVSSNMSCKNSAKLFLKIQVTLHVLQTSTCIVFLHCAEVDPKYCEGLDNINSFALLLIGFEDENTPKKIK